MNILEFFETLAFAGVIALIAVVYRYILLAEPVLHWWMKWGEQFEDKWWHAPIWGCHKCISGQLALWFYLIWRLDLIRSTETVRILNNDYITLYYVTQNSYSLIGHLFAICGAIILSNILTSSLNKWI